MVAPPWFAVPPHGYGGTEAVVASLVDGLVDRGHEVHLIAAGAPGTKAQHYVKSFEEPPTHRLGVGWLPEVITAAETARAFAHLDLDIVHDHSSAGPLLAASREIPTVTTMHGPVIGENGDYFERLGRNVDIVAISDAQRRQNPSLNWVGTVYNSIDVSTFTCTTQKSDDLLWIGRFSESKAAHLAIESARRVGRKILLAGKLNEREEHDYFNAKVAPMLGTDAEYVGEADAAAKRELYARAACLVFPIQWDEPFGMVMIEALASGTPIAAIGRGSVPEVVENGRTGFIAESADDLPSAIEAASLLSPADCRESAERRFDVSVMAAGYERIYRMLVEGSSTIRTITATEEQHE
jgi:glycosyltransferase involved in cell wall biosynthesis